MKIARLQNVGAGCGSRHRVERTSFRAGVARAGGQRLSRRTVSPIKGNDSTVFTPCAYAEVFRRHQRRINQVSEQRTTAQIAAADQRFARIAVTRAEVPKAMAIKDQKVAPIRVRDRISW
jgi:hypothetical protein